MAFIKRQRSESVTKDERKKPRTCDDLVAGLEDPNPVARRWMARDLVACPGSALALVDRLKREGDASVREVILTTLTQIGDPTAVGGLVECLRNGDAALRNEVIETMKQLPDAVAPIMRGLLADEDSDVRIFAVNILETLRHPEVERWLIGVVESDPQVNVCAAAADLLSEVGTEAAEGALVRLKARFRDEPYVRFTADLALKRIHES
jgi:HEAT repeat protein